MYAIKTFDQFKIHFGLSHNIANIDFSWRPRQLDTAAPTASGKNETSCSQIMDYLYQMIAGNAIALRYVCDGPYTASIDPQIKKRSQRIIRI